MIWSSVTGTPRKWKTCTGSGARPGACRMAWLPKISVASDGMATEEPDRGHHLDQGRGQPQVTEEDGVEEDAEHAGRRPRSRRTAAGRMPQLSWVCR